MTVSVVIPTWNRAEYLGAAVRSALAQTAPPLEVLVCDDGSTDGSEAVVRSIIDPRVRWVPGDRVGRPAVPRNRGIREARGDWVAFLDSDDEWTEEKLERQLLLAGKTGCRAVCSNAWRKVPGGERSDGLLLKDLPARITFEDLLRGNHVICSSAVVVRSLLLRSSGFPEAPELKAIEDYALWLRVATQTDIAGSPEPLVRYNDDPGASLRKNDPPPAVQRARVLADFCAWVEGGGAPASYLELARRRWERPTGGGPFRRLAALAHRLGISSLP